MTVASSTSRTGPLDCNGSVTAFTGTFKITKSSEVQVILADSELNETVLTETTDYTVSNIGASSFTVTTVETYSSDYTITMIRNMDFLQETDYGNTGPYLPENHEDSFDKLTMEVQQLLEKVERCAQIPASSPTGVTVVLDEDGTVLIAYLPDGSVTTAKLSANAVTTAKIADLAVTNAKLAGSIAAGKITVADGKLLVGNASNVAAEVTMSGDVTIDNTAVATIGDNKITTAKILDANVTQAKLAANIKYAVVDAYVTWSGGTPSLIDDYGVTGIVDEGTGSLTVTFASDFADTNYKFAGNAETSSGSRILQLETRAVGSVLLRISDAAGLAADPDAISFAIFP